MAHKNQSDRPPIEVKRLADGSLDFDDLKAQILAQRITLTPEQQLAALAPLINVLAAIIARTCVREAPEEGRAQGE